MIFKSDPKRFVNVATKRYKKMLGMNGFYFGEDGLYETNNEMLIKLLAPIFEVVGEVTESATIDLIPEVIVEPTEEIEPVKTTMKKCSKCDFECENQGTMLAHHREKHPKNKGGK
jgi:hypothetical protein